MIRVAIAAAALGAVGFFPALLLARRLIVAILVAPLAAALVTGTLTIACVAARASYGFVVFGTVAVAVACAAVLLGAKGLRPLRSSLRDGWRRGLREPDPGAEPESERQCERRAPARHESGGLRWRHGADRS